MSDENPWSDPAPRDEVEWGSPTPPQGPTAATQGQPWGSTPALDTITPQVPSRSPRRRLPALLAVVGLVVAVAGGGAAFATYRGLSGGGTQPEKYVPANAVGFVKVDLDPAASEKLAVARLAGRFPHGAGKSFDQLKDQLFEQMFQHSAVDYATEVKPWLGSRAAVAVVPHGNSVDVEAVVGYRDRAKAAATLSKAHDLDFSFQSGYVVIGKDTASVNRLVQAAASSHLGQSGHYQADSAKLASGEIVTAWADLGGAISLGESALRALGPGPFTAPGGPGLPYGDPRAEALLRQLLGMAGTGAGADATAKLKKEYGSARAVFGLRATNDAIVASGHLIGAGDSGGVHPTPAALLTGLPNDTVAGVYVSGAATTVDHAFQQLSAQPWFGQLKGSLSGVTQQYGLKIPADLETLLGNQTVFALGNVAAGADFPEFGLIGHSNDPASAADVAKRLSTLGDQLSDGRLRLASERHGENVVLATSDYATKLGAGGHLGDTAGFKSAVGSLTDPVYFAAYVDVKQFTVAMHDTPAPAKPISKIGMSVTGNASDVAFQVRVVIG